MIRIELDKNNYLTGNWAIFGGNPEWTEVEELPTDDVSKLPAYKYENGSYMFDEERYRSSIKEKEDKALSIAKDSLILQSKQNLADYLATHTVTSTCHGDAAEYSITSEKQSYLASMIMTTQMAQAAGIDYQPSWNAAGQVCTYDWTLAQLQQLAFEIESVVRPLVSKQQTMEMQLSEAETMEALEAVDITFGGNADESAE